MPLPSFVGAGSGAAVTTGVLSLSKTSCTAGNIIVLQALKVVSAGSISIDAASNVETLDGTDGDLTGLPTGPIFGVGSGGTSGDQLIMMGRVIADGTVSIDLSSTSGTDGMLGRIYEYEDTPTGTTMAEILDNTTGSSEVRQTVNTTASILDSGITTTGYNSLGFQFVAVVADQALADFSGETGGNWAKPVSEFTSSSPAGAICIQTAGVPTAGSVDGGTITITSNPWASVGTAMAGVPDIHLRSPQLDYDYSR